LQNDLVDFDAPSAGELRPQNDKQIHREYEGQHQKRETANGGEQI